MTVFGSEPLYTPFFERPYERKAHPSGHCRAAPPLIDGSRSGRSSTSGGERRRVAPAVLCAAREHGGHRAQADPTIILQSPEVCHLYVDVRTFPGQRSEPIRRS